jgi:hypothetical protein
VQLHSLDASNQPLRNVSSGKVIWGSGEVIGFRQKVHRDLGEENKLLGPKLQAEGEKGENGQDQTNSEEKVSKERTDSGVPAEGGSSQNDTAAKKDPEKKDSEKVDLNDLSVDTAAEPIPDPHSGGVGIGGTAAGNTAGTSSSPSKAKASAVTTPKRKEGIYIFPKTLKGLVNSDKCGDVYE